jgi:hypothetical protein
MRSKLAFLFLALALTAPAVLLADSQEDRQTSRAPVMVAEIGTSSDVLVLLTIYNDGQAVLARRDSDQPDGEICVANVPAAGLEALQASLQEAGALHLADAPQVPGITRKTISVFIGPDYPARTLGNTFNYYRAEGPYLIVGRAISTILANNFGGCI